MRRGSMTEGKQTYYCVAHKKHTLKLTTAIASVGYWEERSDKLPVMPMTPDVTKSSGEVSVAIRLFVDETSA